MIRDNQSYVTEFILLGFSSDPTVQGLLFLVFSIMYILTLIGNVTIILIVTADSLLQKPMYYFIRNLAFLEICYTSVTVPEMLVNFLSEDKSVSFFGCATQMFFFSFLGDAECCLLAVMSYDRYVAICSPLHYGTIMNKKVCAQMVAACWISGIVYEFGQTVLVFTLPFCGPNKVDHFFCDIPPILKLSCQDPSQNEISVFIGSVILILIPFLFILISYIRILSTILRIRSAERRCKAFSTCASHLISVSLFYGTGIFTYLLPNSWHSPIVDKLFALFYAVLIPMLNPLIYSLRNKEVLDILSKRIGRKMNSPSF
ncbi:olfactory receptor 10A4-like [Rhinatrema bivittatum]|uniref:olfactory receptor 10A4-like n=1 Tax=Rhinatrema bivittatum TaxID=194408 RepID=UPI00112A5316|nr:olfactory receptor 10A4-like [Rhinatrema bivittatum]